MMDGTNLNVLQTSRQMLRAFGGLNEGYGCSEAEFSGEMNFSSRGYPALQTRKMRRNVRTVQGVNGMYHLNGLLICRGKTLEYTPDEEVRTGAVVLENVLTDDRKAMAGMGTKVLIWPDKVGEPALFAIVTEDTSGQVEVLTFKDQRAWRALVRHLQANYEAWLDAEEDEA